MNDSVTARFDGKWGKLTALQIIRVIRNVPACQRDGMVGSVEKLNPSAVTAFCFSYRAHFRNINTAHVWKKRSGERIKAPRGIGGARRRCGKVFCISACRINTNGNVSAQRSIDGIRVRTQAILYRKQERFIVLGELKRGVQFAFRTVFTGEEHEQISLWLDGGICGKRPLERVLRII